VLYDDTSVVTDEAFIRVNCRPVWWWWWCAAVPYRSVLTPNQQLLWAERIVKNQNPKGVAICVLKNARRASIQLEKAAMED
jgi:hypothetical protein